MPRKLPPLNALRAFEASGRYLSFTEAARELLVTQSAVSRHVAALEDWLGVKLFFRRQRGIELTARGEAYFRALSSSLDQIDHATRRVRDNADETLLRLKLPPTFAIRWLAPRLYRFKARHPEIELHVTTSHSPGDFEREDVDVFVHSEFGAPSGEGYRRLFGEVLMPVCSPRLIENGTPLAAPADLAKHVLLASTNRPRDWPLWLAGVGEPALQAQDTVTFDYAALGYQACIDGLGVMIAQRALIADDLEALRLVAPLPQQVRTQGGYYLAFQPNRPKAPRVAAFEAWIMEEGAGSDF